jgi:DNA recombination-dependent growth factor C
MGFLSASTSFVRYRVQGQIPKELWTGLEDRLKNFAFQDIDHTSDERSFGWVSIDNMLDTEWSQASPFKGEFAAFALRLDTRRLSPAVFKKHYQIALEDLTAGMKEQGTPFVGRERKKELREQVRLKLLGRTLPVPAVFDVTWNMQNNRVCLASTQEKVRRLFEDLFTQTFELHLEPLTPYYLALQTVPREQAPMVNEYEPCVFV